MDFNAFSGYNTELCICNYLNQTREITDKFTVEVEMDRRCYEELLDERKNMELTYEERIAQLQDQHAEVRWAFCSFLVFFFPCLAYNSWLAEIGRMC